MEAVGHQRGRADVPADPDPVQGHEFVPQEADHGGDDHPGEVPDRLGAEEPPHRLPPGHDRRQRDHGHDEHPGQVLGPAVAVGVKEAIADSLGTVRATVYNRLRKLRESSGS